MFSRFLWSLPVFFGQVFRFAVICIIIGPLAFYIGQLLPRRNFDYRAFPYALFSWEDGGKIYTKIKLQHWKDKVPDMSQYVKSAFRKKITVFRSNDYLEELILETCVAEMVHVLLMLVSPVFLVAMEGVSGPICMALYILGNIPFILIQRYNRPRLVMLMDRQTRALIERQRRAAPQNA